MSTAEGAIFCAHMATGDAIIFELVKKDNEFFWKNPHVIDVAMPEKPGDDVHIILIPYLQFAMFELFDSMMVAPDRTHVITLYVAHSDVAAVYKSRIAHYIDSKENREKPKKAALLNIVGQAASKINNN